MLMNRKKLIELRDTLQLSRASLGQLLGVTEMTIIRWEGGESAPSGLALDVLFAMQSLISTHGLVVDGQSWGTWLQHYATQGRHMFLRQLFFVAYERAR